MIKNLIKNNPWFRLANVRLSGTIPPEQDDVKFWQENQLIDVEIVSTAKGEYVKCNAFPHNERELANSLNQKLLRSESRLFVKGEF